MAFFENVVNIAWMDEKLYLYYLLFSFVFSGNLCIMYPTILCFLPGSQECETTAKADIVLLVDGSGSIGRSDFEIIRSFLAGMVSNFNIGPDRVQIGLIQYSNNPRTEWHLNTHQTKYSLLKAIANLVQLTGSTNTGRALNSTLQNNFKPNVGMRADSKKIAVLITDGEANDNTLLPSQKLKDAGIEIYAIEFVRLVNGTSLCSGRLEVKTNQSTQHWSSVCEDDFDQMDAEVVCRELGCGAPSVLQGALYREVEAPMWTKEFQCGGNESALLNCRSSDRNTCSSRKAVGLTCSDPVRLVGGWSRCTGTLEVKQGDWRPVDGSDQTWESASVYCRKLSCSSPLSVGRRDDSSNRSAWKINSDCVQSGSGLRECVTQLSWSSPVLELTCLHPAAVIIRLVVLPLTLLLSTIVIYFIMKVQATRGQMSDPQENIELDYYNLGVSRAEGAPAEEEGHQAAE
ncbi:uncharacterized protein LOC120551803 isoform X3 [Perca fluviatilis]|uniref:uncharacterized protein LOC120551803 isoform X3 n=1 Tax=Perca fluviatilis TaxID=8168 RepID=UPI001962F5F1|nr:uncharacterized protein LOC120551803 isoform X3 [Perca fluviatilis]